jgi:heme exporter protein A
VIFARHSLVCTDLACQRGGHTIFEAVNFTLDAGSWLELRGPNGAGKSSLLRLLAGLDEPSHGVIAVSGRPPDQARGESMHFIGHADALKPGLSVQENLQFWSSYLGGASDVAKALDHFQLSALADVSAAQLSEGQKRRLGLARLVAIARPIWLLDEPSVGLDVQSLHSLRLALEQHIAQGGSAIVSTHADLGIAPTGRLDLGVA